MGSEEFNMQHKVENNLKVSNSEQYPKFLTFPENSYCFTFTYLKFDYSVVHV